MQITVSASGKTSVSVSRELWNIMIVIIHDLKLIIASVAKHYMLDHSKQLLELLLKMSATVWFV
jgi:hypothetical protein